MIAATNKYASGLSLNIFRYERQPTHSPEKFAAIQRRKVICKFCGAEYWDLVRHLMSRVAINMKMFSCYSTSTKLIAAKYRANQRKISGVLQEIDNDKRASQLSDHCASTFLRRENQMVVIDKLLVHWTMCLNFRRGDSRLAIKYFKIKEQLPSTTPLVRKAMKKLGPLS